MDGRQLTVYLSGPMTGKTLEEASAWRDHATAVLASHGLRVLSPMRGKTMSLPKGEPLKPGASYKRASIRDEALFCRDRSDVKEADIVLCNLEGASAVSIGSVCEIIWANEFRRFLIVVLPKDGVHDHAFVRTAASVVVRSLDEALECVLEWAGVAL